MTISPPLGPNKVRIVNRPDPANCWRLDRGCLPMCNEFERNGMRIDKPHILRLHDQILGEMSDLAAKVVDLTGEKNINLGSPDQLADLLFKTLKLKQNGREKWTKNRSRLAADSDVLKAMVGQHAAIKPILDWKERQKLKSTYTLSLIAQADENDRIHTDVSTTTAGTQRLTSSRPNLQNIPIRTALGREIRNAFIPKPGNKIGSADASQIEMRMNAVDAMDRNLLTCFWSGDDAYWQVAEITNHQRFSAEVRAAETLCCGCDVPMVNEGSDNDPKWRCHNIGCTSFKKHKSYKKWYRQNAKVTALMVGYDASAGGLYDQFLSYGIPGYTEERCAKEIADYFSYPKGFWGLLKRKKEHHRRAYKHMLVWDMWGFVRWIPQVASQHKRIVAEGLRQAGNLAGQGGAAGIIKLWMAVIWERYAAYWKKHGILMLMQVHDELVAEGPEQVLTDFLAECSGFLRTLLPYSHFDCPLEANYGIDDRWGLADH